MNKSSVAENIKAAEKIAPDKIDQSELMPPEMPRPAAQQVQKSNAVAAAQRAAPMRRPLFRT